jgi:hypothetical protein
MRITHQDCLLSVQKNENEKNSHPMHVVKILSYYSNIKSYLYM